MFIPTVPDLLFSHQGGPYTQPLIDNLMPALSLWLSAHDLTTNMILKTKQKNQTNKPEKWLFGRINIIPQFKYGHIYCLSFKRFIESQSQLLILTLELIPSTISSLMQFIITSLFCFFGCFVFLAVPCGLQDLTWPGIEPGPWAVKVTSPNHWTSREFPRLCF